MQLQKISWDAGTGPFSQIGRDEGPVPSSLFPRPPTNRLYYFAVLLVLVDVCRAAVHKLAEIAGSRLLPFLPHFVPAAIPVLLALTAHMLVAVIRHLNLVHSKPLVALP